LSEQLCQCLLQFDIDTVRPLQCRETNIKSMRQALPVGINHSILWCSLLNKMTARSDSNDRWNKKEV